MKTSNKLILAFFLFQFVTGVAAMVTIRKNITIKEKESYVGNGIVATKVLADSISTNYINVGNNHIVKLDPNASNVVLEFEENIMEHFEISDYDDYFRLNEKSGMDLTYNSRPTLIIGIQGKENLKFNVYHGGTLETVSPITLSSLLIKTGDHAEIDMDVNAKVLSFYSDDEAKVTFKGKIDVVNLETEEDAHVNMDAVDIDVLSVEMRHDAFLSVGNCDVATGFIRDDSKIEFGDKMPLGLIDKKHDAQVIVK